MATPLMWCHLAGLQSFLYLSLYRWGSVMIHTYAVTGTLDAHRCASGSSFEFTHRQTNFIVTWVQAQHEKAAQDAWGSDEAQAAVESASSGEHGVGATESASGGAAGAEETIEIDDVVLDLTPREIVTVGCPPVQAQLDAAQPAIAQEAVSTTDKQTGGAETGAPGEDVTVDSKPPLHEVRVGERAAALIRRNVGAGDCLVTPAEVRSQHE